MLNSKEPTYYNITNSGLYYTYNQEHYAHISKDITITCRNLGDTTEVQIHHKNLNRDFFYSCGVFNIASMDESCDILPDMFDIIANEDDEEEVEIIDFILKVIEEILFNSLLHDGMCRDVKLSIIKLEDKSYPVFNYHRAEMHNIVKGF